MAKLKNRVTSSGVLRVSVWSAVMFCLLALPTIASATVSLTPRLSVRYSANDNVYASDPDQVDSGTATYLDYLLGASLMWREGKSTLTLSADAGYEQFLTLGGYFDDYDPDLTNTDPDERVEPSEFDYVTGQLGFSYRYTGRVVTVEFTDYFDRSRDLQRVFGLSSDALGYWSLLTRNVAGVSLRYSPTPRMRNILNYYYDTLLFDENEDLDLTDLSDSVEHRVLYRGEYDFTPKTTGLIDFQAADRSFSDLYGLDSANFRIYQGLAGVRFSLREMTYLEILGGYAMRDIYQESEMYDMEDSGDGIGRISLISMQPKRYNMNLTVERGLSLYGTNLFFVYTGASLSGRFWLMPKLSVKGAAVYRQAFYDAEINDRTEVWNDDRTDNVIVGNAAVIWDIMEKDGEGTLTLEGGYNYIYRDSNIDSDSDYNSAVVVPWSYDTVMNVYYAQITIKPTFMLGN